MASPSPPRRVVLVHGFTQTGASWGRVADALGAEAPDVTPWCSGGLPAAAARLAEAYGRAAYVGYSMGGRLTLHLALARPDLVERLVLVGATAGIRDPAERDARRDADEELARSIVRDGVDAFLDRWLAQPLFATLAPSEEDLAGRRAQRADVLAAALGAAGTGAQEDLWPRLAELGMPVLLVAGSLDSKFATIAAEMAAAIGPNASVSLIDGAGHACHLERPDEFVALVQAFVHDSASPDASSAP